MRKSLKLTIFTEKQLGAINAVIDKLLTLAVGGGVKEGEVTDWESVKRYATNDFGIPLTDKEAKVVAGSFEDLMNETGVRI